MVGRTDPLNSDNQNGDGGGMEVRVREFVCVRVCTCVHASLHACVMCLQYTIIIFYPG